MLKVAELDVFYGQVQALHGVSLVAAKGDAVALLGANGAGKSTLLMAISGVLKKVSGSMTWNGSEVLGKPAHAITAAGISQVPEGRRVFKNLTIEENLAMGAYLSRAKFKERLEQVYDMFPILRDRRRQMANGLSGGQQQMLALGRALMAGPELLLLDEPSLGLAPGMVEEIYNSIRQLHAAGVGILLVEQNVELALSVTDRAYLLERGHISFEGTASEARSSEQFVASYLGGSIV